MFLKIDCDDLSDTAERYKIRSMPTFKVIKNGAEVGSVDGKSGLWSDLNEKLEKLVVDQCSA